MIKVPKTNYSIDELFARGNYAAVAMDAPDGMWEKYAAYGLIGKTREAIERLKEFDHEQARFYLGVAYWIQGEDAKAIQILEKVSMPHAQNLLHLIRKPKIRILAQLPRSSMAVWDLQNTAEKLEKFEIQNISLVDSRDLKAKLYADVHDYYDPKNPPDFYLCKGLEYHLIPPNLQELPCPILGQTSDYDLHIQSLYPWMHLFDELISEDQARWYELTHLLKKPVSTFPKTYGVSESPPPIPMKPREIDIFFSGKILEPCLPEKAQLLCELMTIVDAKIVCFNGFLSQEEYFKFLGESKVCFTQVRHATSMPTRGLEALMMGCALVTQRNSVLTLYVGEEEGVVVYDFEKGDFLEAIRRVLKDWQKFEIRARKGAEIIRQEFSIQRVSSEYLRFMTFLAAKPRKERQIQPIQPLNHKRTVFSKALGWGIFEILPQILEENMKRWEAQAKIKPTSMLAIDMAREFVLGYATAQNDPKAKSLLEKAFQIFETYIPMFPDSLILRFNYIRTCLHFGNREQVESALNLTKSIVDIPKTAWKIDLMEDIFPWDFLNTHFNYRKYLEKTTEHLMEEAPDTSDLFSCILASLYYYLGSFLQNLEYLRKAVELDPDFPFYKMAYAKQLLEEGYWEESAKLLEELVECSLLYESAFQLLKHLHDEDLYKSPKYNELSPRLNRENFKLSILETWESQPLAFFSNEEFQWSEGVKRGDKPLVAVISRFQFDGEASSCMRSSLQVLKSLGLGFSLNPSKHFKDSQKDGIINLIFCDASDSQTCIKANEKKLLNGGYKIGYLWHQVSAFPQEWKDCLRFFHEIWTPSTFALDVVSRVSQVPVLRIPPCLFFEELIKAKPDRASFGFSESEFLFGFAFDFRETVERKNPEGLFCAFKEAFSPEEAVRLVVLCQGGDSFPSELARLKALAQNHSIKIVDEKLSQEQIISFLFSINCYVSLHRLESFGLKMAEAMALGKPVIATAFSGNMDFMNPSNSYLVKYDLVKLPEDFGLYKKGMSWAEPNLSHAAKLMRHVFENQSEASQVGRLAALDIKSFYSLSNVQSVYKERLDMLFEHQSPYSRSVASSNPNLSYDGLEVALKLFFLKLKLVVPLNKKKTFPKEKKFSFLGVFSF
jgi:glycosyltransferase involved in cell wall biosynthesis